MILAVFSDTHGNVDYLETAAAYALNKGSADVLAHLGDNYDDSKILNQFGKRVVRVPGIFSPQYQDTGVANRILEDYGVWSVLFTHTPNRQSNDLPADLDPEELVRSHSINILLHGHTHEPRIEQIGAVWYINPGHLKHHDKKKNPPSFAILDFSDDSVNVKIIGVLDHSEIMSRELSHPSL